MIWKFRTMIVDADRYLDRDQAATADRITAVGKVLRLTSVDELPQLFNVIEGSMSLVGPRPHATAQNEHYRRLIPGYMLRHKVKPGINCKRYGSATLKASGQTLAAIQMILRFIT